MNESEDKRLREEILSKKKILVHGSSSDSFIIMWSLSAFWLEETTSEVGNIASMFIDEAVQISYFHSWILVRMEAAEAEELHKCSLVFFIWLLRKLSSGALRKLSPTNEADDGRTESKPNSRSSRQNGKQHAYIRCFIAHLLSISINNKAYFMSFGFAYC